MPITKTEAQWRAELSDEAYRVTRQSATEAPFTGAYWNTHETGIYRCICCGVPLFSSEHKFDAHCGWPSFNAVINTPRHPNDPQDSPAQSSPVGEKKDQSHGMVRTEVICNHCHAHLGHVFPDGPPPTGLRYCINSAALVFEPKGHC